MNTNERRESDEAGIRVLVESWARAVRAKNREGILADHAENIRMFDVPPPLQSVGLDAYGKTWNLFYSSSPDPCPFDIQEIRRCTSLPAPRSRSSPP